MLKKIITCALCLISVAALCSCDASKSPEDETATVEFDSPEDAYEAMTGAVNDGDYDAADLYYRSGAASANKDDTAQWYLYAKAGKAYEDGGCGYAYELCESADLSEFNQAQKLMSEIVLNTRAFDGVFSNGGVYIYICNGKIAAAIGEQLSGTVMTTEQIYLKDGKYYWAERRDGADTIKYELTLTNEGLYVAAYGESSDELYVGTYSGLAAEMPVITMALT